MAGSNFVLILTGRKVLNCTDLKCCKISSKVELLNLMETLLPLRILNNGLKNLSKCYHSSYVPSLMLECNFFFQFSVTVWWVTEHLKTLKISH